MLKFLQIGLILLALLVSSCSFASKPIDGIYLIPKGYEGGVILLYNQPDGVFPTVENGRYVYEIPKNGLLKIKSQSVAGRFQASYFLVDENGEREKIDYLYPKGWEKGTLESRKSYSTISQDEYESGVFVMGREGIGSFNIKGSVIRFSSFIVGKPKDGELLYEETHRRITNIQRGYSQ